jgi:hypothetical protein
MTSNYNEGERVELAPHLDAWTQGDRYATVLDDNGQHVLVLMEKSGRQFRMLPNMLTLVRNADNGY